MAANQQQATRFINGVLAEAKRKGFPLNGVAIEGGKGDHGKIEWTTPDGFVFRDGFRAVGSDKHPERQQVRKLVRAHAMWIQQGGFK